jgi:hypothetical protein
MSDIIGHNEPITEIACGTCRHYNREDMKHFSCLAFKIIPKIILSGDNMHAEPLKDQGNKTVYEPENK